MTAPVKPEAALKIAKDKRSGKYTDDRFREGAIQELTEVARLPLCRALLAELFPKLATPAEAIFLADYARILAMLLGARPRQIDLLENRCLIVARELLNTRGDPADADLDVVFPSASKLLIRLMEPFGFSNAPGVCFAGDAGTAFDRVVVNKMLFVDGISSIHGEFSHSIQWLYVGYMSNGFEAGHPLKLQKPLAELYANSVLFKMAKGATLDAERGGNPYAKACAVWDVCVDCFLPGRVSSPGNNLLTCVFSESMRCPALFQRALMDPMGALADTYLGKMLRARSQRLQFKGRPLAAVVAETHSDLQKYYLERNRHDMTRPVAPKPRVMVPGNVAFIRDPFQAGPIARQPGAEVANIVHRSGNVLTTEDVQGMARRANAAGGNNNNAAGGNNNNAAGGNNNNAPAPTDYEGMWLNIFHPPRT